MQGLPACLPWSPAHSLQLLGTACGCSGVPGAGSLCRSCSGCLGDPVLHHPCPLWTYTFILPRLSGGAQATWHLRRHLSLPTPLFLSPHNTFTNLSIYWTLSQGAVRVCLLLCLLAGLCAPFLICLWPWHLVQCVAPRMHSIRTCRWVSWGVWAKGGGAEGVGDRYLWEMRGHWRRHVGALCLFQD